MHILVFDKTTNGLPTTTLVDERSTLNDLSFTHAALWGPLTASFSFTGTLDDGFTYADRYLGNPVEIWSPNGEWCWEGYIWAVRFGAGRRRRIRSLEGYANLVYVHYQQHDFANDTDEGTAYTFAADGAQEAIYGTIAHSESGGRLSNTDATDLAARTLAERTRLLWLPESGTLGGTGSSDTTTIMVECAGWYRTFYYLPFSADDTEVDTSALVIDMCAANPFISTDTSRVETTAYYTSVTYDLAEAFVPFAERIKELFARASNWTFRLDRGRVPVVTTHKRLSTTVDYEESLDGRITTAGGGELATWSIRPDSVLRQVDFVPSSASLTAAIDSIENVYVAETTWRMPGEVSYRAAIAGPDGEVLP